MSVNTALADIDKGRLGAAWKLLTDGRSLSPFESEELHEELSWALAAQTISRWRVPLRDALADSGLRDHLSDYLLLDNACRRVHILRPVAERGIPLVSSASNTACGLRVVTRETEHAPRGAWVSASASAQDIPVPRHCLGCERFLAGPTASGDTSLFAHGSISGDSPDNHPNSRWLRETREHSDYPTLDEPEARHLERGLHTSLAVALPRLTTRMSAPVGPASAHDPFAIALGQQRRGRHDPESELTALADQALPEAALGTLVAFTSEAGGRALRRKLSSPVLEAASARHQQTSAEDLSQRIPEYRWHKLLDELLPRQPDGRTSEQRSVRANEYVLALEHILLHQ